MAEYFHSVRLDHDRCRGCTNCIKPCPTEAIRVRSGKAMIIEERCIDCGECIRICPNNAKYAVTDPIADLSRFDYAVALPAPSLFGQFRPEVEPAAVLGALLAMGFHDVYEVAVAAEAVTEVFRRQIQRSDLPRPLISPACPAVVRLIQVRFPSLLEHLMRIESPMEVAARLVRERATAEGRQNVGTFFITPCPAKVTAIRQPVGLTTSYVDGGIAMSAIYGEVLKLLDRGIKRQLSATGLGIGWGRAGGEAMGLGNGTVLAVDGIHSVAGVLEEVERGRLRDIAFIEAQACVGGCIGGPLVVQNPFVARSRLRRLAEAHWADRPAVLAEEVDAAIERGVFSMSREIQARPVLKLDAALGRAISMMRQLEEIHEQMPGLDCGACGSPSCRAFAEDIVRGDAVEADCIIKLRSRVLELAEDLLVLARKVPPAMGTREKGVDEDDDSRRGGPPA
jgi:Na+-translocating ferredoxin:NAD+ oxidoreductase RNF subunit RnfB